MKLKISELCSDCCPENVTLGTSDAELTARIKAKTLKKIGVQPTRRRVRVRTLLLAAAIAAFFGSAAYAVVRYNMNLQDVQDQDEVVSGRVLEVSTDGEVLSDQTFYFPDASMYQRKWSCAVLPVGYRLRRTGKNSDFFREE